MYFYSTAKRFFIDDCIVHKMYLFDKNGIVTYHNTVFENAPEYINIPCEYDVKRKPNFAKSFKDGKGFIQKVSGYSNAVYAYIPTNAINIKSVTYEKTEVAITKLVETDIGIIFVDNEYFNQDRIDIENKVRMEADKLDSFYYRNLDKLLEEVITNLEQLRVEHRKEVEKIGYIQANKETFEQLKNERLMSINK